MTTVAHLIIAGKGGVGKSLAASFLTQYLMSKGKGVFCADTDVNNGTFSGYNAFNSKRYTLIDKDFNLIPHDLDILFQDFMEQENDAVIDTGASTFAAMCQWIKEVDLVTVLKENCRQLVVHLVMNGGKHESSSFYDFRTITELIDAPTVIWENQFHGPVMLRGVPLSDLPGIIEHPLYRGIITIPYKRSDRMIELIQQMEGRRLTFDEMVSLPDFFLLNRSSLLRYKNDIFNNIESVLENDNLIGEYMNE